MNAQAKYAGDISTGGTLDPFPETFPKIDEAISGAMIVFLLSFVYEAFTLSPAYSCTHVRIYNAEEINALGHETNTYARTLNEHEAYTVDREIFTIKNFCWWPFPTKLNMRNILCNVRWSIPIWSLQSGDEI